MYEIKTNLFFLSFIILEIPSFSPAKKFLNLITNLPEAYFFKINRSSNIIATMMYYSKQGS